MVDVERKDKVSNTGSRMLFIGLLVGVAAGAIVALFFAPKPGKEIRKNIVNQPKEKLQMVKGRIENIKEKVTLIQTTMRKRAEEEASKVEAPK